MQAMAFTNAIAQLAEEADHHPTITINYNKVSLRLTTHDTGNTVTPKDHELAQAITALIHRDFSS
jgi:4a-hydroxytetrahydrobiopterin dehydratase